MTVAPQGGRDWLWIVFDNLLAIGRVDEQFEFRWAAVLPTCCCYAVLLGAAGSTKCAGQYEPINVSSETMQTKILLSLLDVHVLMMCELLDVGCRTSVEL
jgi:hypothetical protein